MTFAATAEHFHKDRNDRLGLGRRCKPCAIAASRRIVQSRPAEEKQYQRDYYLARRRARIKSSNAIAARRRRGPEREAVLARERAWAQANRAALVKSNREWCHRNPLKVAAMRAMRRGRDAAAGRPLSASDLAKQLDSQGGRCYYCAKDVMDAPTVDHDVPVSRGGTNDLSNIVIACGPCNSRKGARTSEEYRAATAC